MFSIGHYVTAKKRWCGVWGSCQLGWGWWLRALCQSQACGWDVRSPATWSLMQARPGWCTRPVALLPVHAWPCGETLLHLHHHVHRRLHHYGAEVRVLEGWHRNGSLSFNVSRSAKLVTLFVRKQATPPFMPDGDAADRVSSFKFPEVILEMTFNGHDTQMKSLGYSGIFAYSDGRRAACSLLCSDNDRWFKSCGQQSALTFGPLSKTLNWSCWPLNLLSQEMAPLFSLPFATYKW